jgi:hypothetical protein
MEFKWTIGSIFFSKARKVAEFQQDRFNAKSDPLLARLMLSQSVIGEKTYETNASDSKVHDDNATHDWQGHSNQDCT